MTEATPGVEGGSEERLEPSRMPAGASGERPASGPSSLEP